MANANFYLEKRIDKLSECISSSTTVIASGADTYTWSNSTIGNSITVSPTITTTYSVIGTNSITDCATNSLISVYIQSLCPVSAGSPYNTICIGQSTPAQAGIADNFSWSSNPSSVITASTINHSSYTNLSPVITTTYYVTATSMLSSCPGTASFVIIVNSCLGVKNETEDLYKINIYPNPADEILNVEFKIWNDNDSYKIEIINTLGQVVQITSIQSQKTTLNIKELNGGVYQLKISEGNRQSVIKFIKN